MPIDIDNDTLDVAIKKLKAKEDTYSRLEAISKFGSWEVNLKTHQSKWSDQSFVIYGLDKNTTQPTLELFLSHVVSEDLEAVETELKKAISSGKVTSFSCRIRQTNGNIRNVLISGQVIYDENSLPDKIIGTTRDISEQISIQRDSDELSKLIKYSSNEIYIVEYTTLKYLYVNQGACHSLGFTQEELLGKTIFDINPDLTMNEVIGLKVILKESSELLNRSSHKRKDGTSYEVQAYIHKLQYKGIEAFVVFDTDISQLVQAEKLLKIQNEKLNHQANHDALTDLPNRMLFQDRLSQVINFSQRNSHQFALLFIDLDQFKTINDSLGHHIGDKVLIQTAARLESVLRSEDTLARLGGDEFTIILRDVDKIQDAASVARKIISIMKDPMIIQGHKLFVSASIGISMYPQDATNSEDIIKYADAAMYKAKDEGRNNYQFYSSEMTEQAFERVVLESALKVAVKEEQFIVYYQPQYHSATKELLGMEALVRWDHPQIGLIPPTKFISIAEESGLIIDIDRIVMKKAMKQFAQWYRDGYNPGTLALNLAMKHLNKDDFIPTLLNIMNSLSFKPSWLELEVTEGQIMKNPDKAILKLREISEIGIGLAIDDFGTGYSSLAYLKKLPLDKLKIDRSFIKDIPQDEDDMAITKAIIALGQSLNLRLIAEGVETQEQVDFLTQNNCLFIQGYVYSMPIAQEEMTTLLKSM